VVVETKRKREYEEDALANRKDNRRDSGMQGRGRPSEQRATRDGSTTKKRQLDSMKEGRPSDHRAKRDESTTNKRQLDNRKEGRAPDPSANAEAGTAEENLVRENTKRVRVKAWGLGTCLESRLDA